MLDNKNIQKVFSLSDFRKKQLVGDVPQRTRETFREYGYFGGGSFILSTVDRIDYSNDTATASVRGPLSLAKQELAATGNSNFGYFGGGGDFSPILLIDRIDYSNDTAQASPRGPLSLGRIRLAATGNQNFGYFGGGSVPGPTVFSTVDRIDYSDDLSTSLVRGSLSLARGQLAATGNSNFGYFGGGNIAGFGNGVVDRINYSNDTQTTSTRGNLANVRGSFAATGNSNFGYFGGGSGFPGPTRTLIDRIDYSNDTAQASIRGPLSSARYGLSATGNANFGYFGGGSPGPFSTIDRIDYSNDSITASIRGPLSLARGGLAATSSASFGGSPISQYGVFAKPFGYFGGGLVPGTISTIDRIDYSSDTSSSLVRNNLNQGRNGLSATGNSNFGYFGGGTASTPGTSGELSIVDRIDYSNDSVSLSPKGSLSLSRHYSAATGNSNFGYFSGGVVSSPSFSSVSTIDRINYSNDTSTASARGPLSSARYVIAATGTFNFGYFGGGASGPLSTIDRINYSNDTSTTSVRGPLGLGRSNLSATGNQNFGYFGGGASGPVSTVDRIDYSNDTATASVRGPLGLGRSNLSATGNQNFGYFGGGNPGPVSTVDRIDYSNDTATASVRGPLSSVKQRLSASSPTAFGGATDFTPTQTFFDIQSMKRIEDTTNYSVKKRALGSFGYFSGGDTAFNVATTVIDRIDYSNDLVSSHTRRFLNLARSYHAQFGNRNYGYLADGREPVTMAVVSRLDYSNDTSGDIVRTPSPWRNSSSSVSNDNFGYIGTGSNRLTTIDRINYSNDTSLQLSRASNTKARASHAASSNSNYGYFGGGNAGSTATPTIMSNVERLDFSNDSGRLSVRGPLSNEVARLSATGNQNFGYFAGGGGINPKNFFGSNSMVLRINYSTDTVTTSIRGPLSSARYNLAATGTSNFGYFGGGQTPGLLSRVDRIDYSNDTQTPSIRTPLHVAKYATGASTNARTS